MAKKKTLYKLTDENGRTYGGMQWGEGVVNVAKGEKDQPLCSDGWLHAYEHPFLAILLNPIHANFKNPRMWEVVGAVEKRDGQLKCGSRKLQVVKEIPVPKITTEMRVKFAILCSLEVCKDAKYIKWANAWLGGIDRSEAAADAAWAAARAAEAAAAWAARAEAARAAAAWAARAWAARAEAARAAEEAAAWAAEAAAWARAAAVRAGNLDLIKLAEKACNVS